MLAQPPLFVVADGLGGHEAGEVASSIAVETLRDHAPRRADAKALGRAVEPPTARCIRAAREGIGRSGHGHDAHRRDRRRHAHRDRARRRLARLPAARRARCERLTQDHSMVADMIRQGQLTEAESRVHPNRSVITRALGTDPNMVADTFEVDAAAGRPAAAVLRRPDRHARRRPDRRDPRALPRPRRRPLDALIDAANDAGGHDNITVVVVDIDGDGARGRRRARGDRKLRGVLAVLAVAARVRRSSWRRSATAPTATRSAAHFLIAENGVVVVYRGVPGHARAATRCSGRCVDTTSPVAALPPCRSSSASRDGVSAPTASRRRCASPARYRAMSRAPRSASSGHRDPTTPTP